MPENAEDLLFPGDKTGRPVISYRIEEGSVRHILKTPLPYIIGFNAIIDQGEQLQSIDFPDVKTARALERIQHTAVKRDYSFSIRTSLDGTSEIKIDSSTRFYRTEAIRADAEFYFYGKITSAGGKDRANIHYST